jgi:hypothetical protein
MGSSKLGDIKETATDTVEILRQLGTPGVQETLDKVKSMTVTVKEIMETMKSPEWVQNMENIRKIVDDVDRSSEWMENTVRQLKETGVFDEAKTLMQSARKTMNAFGSADGAMKGQEMRDVLVSVREMIQSVKLLTDELKVAATESRQSGAIKELQEAARDISGAYSTVKRAAAEAR